MKNIQYQTLEQISFYSETNIVNDAAIKIFGMSRISMIWKTNQLLRSWFLRKYRAMMT